MLGLGHSPSIPNIRRNEFSSQILLWGKKESDSCRKLPQRPVVISLLFELVCNQTAFLDPFMDIYVTQRMQL